MSSTTLSEPFQLYLGSTLAQKKHGVEALYTTYNRDFPGYVTVSAQGDGIHVLDLRSHHAVASFSVNEYNLFSIPTFSLFVKEDGYTSVISYALMLNAPALLKEHRGRAFWLIRQRISGTTVAGSDKTPPVVLVDVPPVKVFGTGHDTAPLLFVSKNGSLFLMDAQLNIKSQLDWPGEREHVESFVFSRKSCSFIHNDTSSYSKVAVTCCRVDMVLHVRLVLIREEIVPVGTCEISIPSSTIDTDIVIYGLTCSSSGVLSFIDSRGVWATYQLTSLNSSLVSTPISKILILHLQRFTIFKGERQSRRKGLSIISLDTSLVLLAALVDGIEEISLQIWDLSYGVLLTTQSMPVPSAIRYAHLGLTVADEGQILLTVSPSSEWEKNVTPKRSSIHVVPIDTRLKSSIAAALGKTALTAKWLMPKIPDNQKPQRDDQPARTIYNVQVSLKNNNAQKAEHALLEWVKSHKSKEAALGHEFVKKILNIILVPDSSTSYPYTPRITRYLLENAVVSTVMFNGRLITVLRQRGDWENLMFALTVVADISEDELVASVKFLIDRQRRSENAMDVDASEGYIPPLWSYLFACVSYPFSVAPMRLAIRKYLPDAQDLVLILEILENWIQGGTEYEVEALLKSVVTDTKMSTSTADSPPYPKIIAFLHALLDASFVALLQYQPAHDPLRRILSYVEPEITLIDSLEPLRGMLEPFVKAQLLKEKGGAAEESPVELRKRKKQLEEQAGLNIGLYRLEELVI